MPLIVTFTRCAARFGGLTPLLAKFPDIFELSNDPPFNHISIASSFNAADADLVPSLTHSLTHSITQSLTHARTHLLSHAPAGLGFLAWGIIGSTRDSPPLLTTLG